MKPAPYQIGQQVFVVEATPYRGDDVPCPVCFGQLWVELTLGDGSKERVECEYCSLGCSPPSGKVKEHVVKSSVTPTTVVGLRYDEYSREWEVETRLSGEIFADQESAEARRVVAHAAAEDYRKRMDEDNFNRGKKKITWSAGYHQEYIKKLTREMEYHQNKLMQKKKKP